MLHFLHTFFKTIYALLIQVLFGYFRFVNKLVFRWYLDENLRNRGFTVDSDEFSSVKTNSCISTDV